MKVQTTKTLKNYLNKYMPKGYKLSYAEMLPRDYEINVNYGAWYENENDYLINKNKYRVFIVNYPPEFYAVPRFITTNNLIKIFQESDKTAAGFIDEFIKEIEI